MAGERDAEDAKLPNTQTHAGRAGASGSAAVGGDAPSSDSSRRVTFALAFAVAAHAATLALAPALFVSGPLRSHFRYDNKALWLAAWPNALPLLGTLAILALALAWFARRNDRRAVAALFIAAIGLQWSLAWLEGRGAERLSSTLLDPHYGHSEFVVLASEPRPLLELARRYESIAADDTRFVYARSKPPGQLLFYAACDRLMRVGRLEDVCASLARAWRFHVREPFTSVGVFDTLAFLLLSCTPVLALAALARRLRVWLPDDRDGSTAGVTAALALLLMPCMLLVTMHLDQVLYPLLVSLALGTALLAVPERPVFAFAAGVVLAAAMYVSFSLATLAGVIALFWLSFAIWGERHDSRAPARWATVARCAVWGLAGALAGLLALSVGLGFEPLAALTRSLAHHEAWRGTGGLMGPVVTAHNLAEFAIWIGLPATVLLVSRLVRLVRQPLSALAPLEGFTLLYLPFLVAVSVFGHTRSEVGRLWIPLAVPLALPLADELRRAYGRRPWPYVTAALAAVLLVKNFQDFQ